MNKWDEIKKFAIVEADDFQDRWDRNGLNFLFYWKSKYPKFKISLFTIPDRTSKEFLELVSKHNDWIELVVHGWNHESNFECYGWDYDKATALMSRIKGIGSPETRYYELMFKAPGWTITPTAYPAAPEDPLAKDPTQVYRALRDLGFIIVDRHYNKDKRPEGCKVICIDCQPDIVHMHTWNMMTPDPNERNGFQQVEEDHGVPWDQNTEFKFMSEAWEEGLFKPCQG